MRLIKHKMVSKEVVEHLFFEEIVKEAKIGKVDAAHLTYNIRFDTVYDKSQLKADHMYPILYIDDKEKFLDTLTLYVNEMLINIDKNINNIKNKEYIKYYLTFLFVNATYSDFENPINFINRYINYIKDKTFSSYNDNKLMDIFDDSYITADNYIAPLTYEALNLFSVRINSYNEKYFYNLPTVCYSIDNDTCYIYAVQNKKDISNNLEYEKIIKRRLYKINEGVYKNKSQEYKNINDSYYLEEISDVSPSSILSLTVFLFELKKNGISKVKVVPYLPIRYFDKLELINERVTLDNYFYNPSLIKQKKRKLKLEKEHLRIQNNLTNKFIRNFFRLEFHFNNINISSIPMELDEFMNIYINDFVESNNKVLNQIVNQDQNIKKC